MYKIIKEEFENCLYCILKEPAAIEADYYLDRIDDYIQALKEHVEACREAVGKKTLFK